MDYRAVAVCGAREKPFEGALTFGDLGRRTAGSGLCISTMIGVAVRADERDIVAEFFELFKTLWEFYRSGVRYDVVLCTSDDYRCEASRLLLVLGGAATRV